MVVPAVVVAEVWLPGERIPRAQSVVLHSSPELRGIKHGISHH